MANTMTNRDFYTAIANGTMTDEIKAFAVSALAKIDSKNEKRRNTDTKTQTDNKALLADIVSGMVAGTVYTAKAIADQYSISTQKSSALLRQAVADGRLTVIDKYKAEGSKSAVKGYTLTVDEDTETED